MAKSLVTEATTHPTNAPVLNPKASPSSNQEPTKILKTEAEQEQETESEYVTGYKLAVVVASVALSCFLMLLDTMVISTAIPRITDTFHSLTDVGCAAPQPLTGRIYTHFSTKWTFLAFFGIFELGSPSSSINWGLLRGR
ncbi:hypothetical protein DL767_001754 [Monosporascus sp. MG133]|nr:hypothetical protein DL767_001754 [Monosporascus sp. MG133]